MLFGGINTEGNTPWIIMSAILFLLIAFGCATLIADFDRLKSEGCNENRSALFDFPLILLLIMQIVMIVVIAVFILRSQSTGFNIGISIFAMLLTIVICAILINNYNKLKTSSSLVNKEGCNISLSKDENYIIPIIVLVLMCVGLVIIILFAARRHQSSKVSASDVGFDNVVTPDTSYDDSFPSDVSYDTSIADPLPSSIDTTGDISVDTSGLYDG